MSRNNIDTEHIAWAGFWIGLGIVIAALIVKGV